ncbi:MAG: S-layer homology domain-containing protein [Acidimicrobiia bacterium]|nr:S-layer homology domain-containing protein [Acidimicrobiia bacterium]
MRRRTITLLGGITAVILLSAGTGAFAAQQFSDVPDTNPFSPQISALADACITSGFPDGTFRPADSLSRQAEAAFIGRSGAQVAVGNQGSPITFGENTGFDSGLVPLASVSITVPEGLEGCGQQIHLTGTANLLSIPASAPCFGATHCNAYLSITDAEDERIGTGIVRFTDNASGATVSVQAVVEAPPGDHSFALEVWSNRVALDSAFATQGRLVATRVPFGT